MGIDYAWYNSQNELTFINSLKMKLSVIIGVSHMLLGILMKGFNSLYFGKKLDFFFEFIPQFVLLSVWFGYMDLLIIVKWLTYYPNTNLAPSVVTTMISMALKGGGLEKDADGNITQLAIIGDSQPTISILMFGKL